MPALSKKSAALSEEDCCLVPRGVLPVCPADLIAEAALEVHRGVKTGTVRRPLSPPAACLPRSSHPPRLALPAHSQPSPCLGGAGGGLPWQLPGPCPAPLPAQPPCPAHAGGGGLPWQQCCRHKPASVAQPAPCACQPACLSLSCPPSPAYPSSATTLLHIPLPPTLPCLPIHPQDDLSDLAHREPTSPYPSLPPVPLVPKGNVVDVFGQRVEPIALDQVACPSCGRKVAAGRFAPHLDKCMGRGRQASRTANQRFAMMDL